MLAWCFCWVVLAFGTNGSEQQFEIRGPAGSTEDWPVTIGVPLLPGELPVKGDLVMRDARGRSLEGSTEVAARWPDGTVRWAWVHTAIRLDAGGRALLKIRPRRTGREDSRSPWRKGSGGAWSWDDELKVSPRAPELLRLYGRPIHLEIESSEGGLASESLSDRRIVRLRDTIERSELAIDGRFPSVGLRYRAWLTSWSPFSYHQLRIFLFGDFEGAETASVRLRALQGVHPILLREIPPADRPRSVPPATQLELVPGPRTWPAGVGEHHRVLLGRPGGWTQSDLTEWPLVALPEPKRFGRVFTGEPGWRASKRSGALAVSLGRLFSEMKSTVDWQDRGDWRGYPGSYGNLEYDTSWGLLAHAVRSREAHHVRWADRMLSHLDGVDLARHPPNGWPSGLPYRHGKGHRGPLELGHVWLDGVWAHHWLTGDAWSLELARTMGEGLLQAVSTRSSDRDIVRGAGWTLVSLAAALRGTRDSRFEEALRVELRRALSAQLGSRGCFDLPREKEEGDDAWIEVTTWVQAGVLGEGLYRAWIELGDPKAKRGMRRLCEWVCEDAWSKGAEAFHVFVAYERAGPGIRRGAILRKRVESAFLGATLARGMRLGVGRSARRILEAVRDELNGMSSPYEPHRNVGRPLSMLLRCAPALALD